MHTILFTDKAKLVKIIKSEQGAINLQLYINNLVLWCNKNHLFLNIFKTQGNTHIFDYT